MTGPLQRLRDAKKVGFVFSGGSARCAFQVGAVERLLELGIRPAITVGVSAGSWNAAILSAHIEQRARYVWKSFGRMPSVDLRNLFIELSPWRYAQMHRRNFARFFGDRLHVPEALPCFISVTRLRDRRGFLIDVREVEKPIELLLAANYLPPFYTRAPRIFGERFGDGGVTDNAPYEFAIEQGCDAVVLICMKGESEGGIYKSTADPEHEVPAAFQDRVLVIRPRHRLPYGFVERRWPLILEMIQLGDLRTREILLGERHAETDIRAPGMSPSVRLLRLWRMLTGGRGSAAATRGPAEPAQQ